MLGGPREAVSERIGQVFVALLLPAVSAAADAEDRGAMQFELIRLAFALAAYRADHGSYPAKLADLAPKYVAEVPKDIFNAAELHYRREGEGYLLYSVGVNGKDDGAKSYEDRKDGRRLGRPGRPRSGDGQGSRSKRSRSIAGSKPPRPKTTAVSRMVGSNFAEDARDFLLRDRIRAAKWHACCSTLSASAYCPASKRL